MPWVGSDRRVKQRNGDAVLTHLHWPESHATECDICVIAGSYALAFHEHVFRQTKDSSTATATDEIDIAGESRFALEIDESRPLIGSHDPCSHIGDRLTVRLFELAFEKRLGQRSDAPPISNAIRQTCLDGLVAASLALQLEGTRHGVEIGTGSNLEPPPPALQVVSVGQEVGRVEVRRLVREASSLIDLQRGVPARQPTDQLSEAGDGNEVFSLVPCPQRHLFSNLSQAYRGQPVHRGSNRRRGRRSCDHDGTRSKSWAGTSIG